jgi:glycopeptide antibiotics resistance protein
MVGFVLELHLPFFLILLALAFATYFLIDFIFKKNRRTAIDYSIHYSFIFYLLCLIKFVFFPIAIYYHPELVVSSSYVQLIPFKSIAEAINNKNYIQIFGNIILLMPLSVYWTILNRRAKSFRYSLFFGFVITFTIELIQLLIDYVTHFSNKYFDVDDLILNTFGFVLGWFLAKILAKKLNEHGISTAFIKQEDRYKEKIIS